MKKDAKNPEFVYAWRPDFRDAEALPDISAVRSGFFTLVLSLSFLAVCLLYIGYDEFQIRNLEESIAVVELEIESKKEVHAEKVEQNKRFRLAENKIKDIESFVEGQLVASDFFLDLGSRLSKEMNLQNVRYDEDGIIIEGLVMADAEAAAVLVKSYIERLKNDAVDQSLFGDYKLIDIKRDTSGDEIRFSINMSEPGDGKKK